MHYLLIVKVNSFRGDITDVSTKIISLVRAAAGITVSKEQLVEAQQRVKAAGLSEQVTLMFCDYRHVPGKHVYDAVVSCEMIEAVGHEHLPTYFAMVGRVLKPGGMFAMQVHTAPPV